MKYTFAALMERVREEGEPLWRIILSQEQELTGLSKDRIMERLNERYEVMAASARGALERPLPTAGNLISGCASQHQQYLLRHNGLCGDFINRVMAHALSCSEVNAAMGRICACPTAGACGIVPAVLVTMEEDGGYSRQESVEALLVAAGVGAIVMDNASVAGAVGGCQAECGVAGAMAAAAAVQLAGGTARQCCDAFGIALMNVMGLVCDPIAGLVQIPCAQRNASQAVGALLAADLALGGMRCPVTPDEMVSTMAKVGAALPLSLRETAMGGIAATASARAIEESIFADARPDRK